MKQNKISIKWRLFIYLSIFVGATLILLWLFQVVFLDSFYKAIKTNDIKTYTQSIVKNIDNENLEDLVGRISQDGDVCILITDEEGNILHSADASPACVIHRMSPQQFYLFIRKAEENNGSYLERFDRAGFRDDIYNENRFTGKVPPKDRGMEESIIYTHLVTQKDGTDLVVFLNANITPVDATVMTIRYQLIYVTIIMLVLALILALWISKRISKPIIQINKSSKELARGNYDVQFDCTGYQEIAELASTLNYATSELAKTENLRKELIANVSHDLRTPLTMITGYAEILRDLPGENTPENVQVIIDEAKRLTGLVNDMLDISKLESGTQSLQIRSYNLTASIRNILGRYTKLIEQNGYQIRFLYDADVWVQADSLKISQVLYNLINNAITYTGKDKTVIVRQSIVNRSVTIEIIDTGEGIPQEQLADIWNRYYKVDKEHKRAQIGTGLGLSIVKTILEMHGAAYGVQSTLGQGSLFWFSLPTMECNLPKDKND